MAAQFVRHHFAHRLPEVTTRFNQARKEVGQPHFRAKGRHRPEHHREDATLTADDEMKMNALWETVQTRLVRRNVAVKNFEVGSPNPLLRRRQAGHQDPGGHPHRGGAKRSQPPEGPEAEEGAGIDPGRSGSRHLRLERRPAGRHESPPRARFRRRAAVRQLQVITFLFFPHPHR